VSPRSLVHAWDTFFFSPQSPTPVALYRIFYGLLVVTTLALLHGDWLTWYGVNAFMRIETMHKVEPGIRLNLFLVMPQNDTWVQAFFWVFLLFAVFLTVGFLSRFSSIAVFLCLLSVHQRNLFILHSGDTLLRATGFFLMFAPAGAAISVDRLWRLRSGKEGLAIKPRSPWAQRMIQIQMSLAYLSTFLWKIRGSEWLNGTALYYTTRLAEFQRFPMPTLEPGIILRLATWSALFVEFAAGVLVWIRKLRYWVLLLGLCLHLFIEYSMNVPLFQWVIMATYVCFIDPADLSRAWAWVRRQCGSGLVDVLYDGSRADTAGLANVLLALDVFGRLHVTDRQAAGAPAAWTDASDTKTNARFIVLADGSAYEGFKGLLMISRLVPLLWPLAPFSFLPGQGRPSLKAAKATK